MTTAARGNAKRNYHKLLKRNWLLRVQPADTGWPTGNGKKLSCSQVRLGQATGLAVASFLSISYGPSYVRRLYILNAEQEEDSRGLTKRWLWQNKEVTRNLFELSKSGLPAFHGLWHVSFLFLWFLFVKRGAKKDLLSPSLPRFTACQLT